MSRRVLIVSPHFPPSNAPDHQRVRMSLPYFRAYGWNPVVLAVDPAGVEVPLDPYLAATVPADVPVHRVSALSSRWTRRFGLGNVAYRSWFQLEATGNRLLRDGRFDLVYFSTTQYVATALGARWRRKFGVPFVIDLQDPWRTDYYERPGSPRPPGGWKYRFARWQAARMEEPAWRDAAGFISVSPLYFDQLRNRYPWFAGKPAAVIPFGAPEADFALARADDTIPVAFPRVPGRVNLASVGAIGPIMRPALETLFAGLARLRAEQPEDAASLRLHFIGTSYAPAGLARPSVQPIALAHGVGDLVSEQPARIGYFTALKSMLAADALLLPGSNDPGYSPSKIGACFLARRPVLAIVPEGSAAAERIAPLGFARMVSPDEDDATGAIATFLSELVRGHASDGSLTRDETRFAAEATAKACTQRQCALFDRALLPAP